MELVDAVELRLGEAGQLAPGEVLPIVATRSVSV
jgi:hypothetical protein